jgi:hypothetical protein
MVPGGNRSASRQLWMTFPARKLCASSSSRYMASWSDGRVLAEHGATIIPPVGKDPDEIAAPTSAGR